MGHVLLAFGLVMLLTGCTHSSMPNTSIEPIKSQVIFIPGFYGTRLVRESDGKIVWISASQALFGSKTVARTGFEVPGAMTLVPSTVLDRIRLIPGLYSVDIYGDFIDEIRDHLGANAQVHLLGYDWRGDYYEGVKKLDTLVGQLKQKGATSISLIAHSMGGLITGYYLRYGAQEPTTAVETWEGARHIDKVVMAAVPFKGTLTPFRNIKYGVTFGLNTTLVKPHAFASFVSSYELLPFYTPVLLDHDLQPLPYTLFESDLWKREQWGFLNTNTPKTKEVMEKRFAFISTSLRRGRILYERMNHPMEKKPELHTQLLYLFSTSHPTPTKGILLEDETEASQRLILDQEDFEKHLPTQAHNALFEDGDKTVSTYSAQLPSAFKQVFEPVTEHESHATHSQIYNDKETREKVLAFLLKSSLRR